MPPRSRLRWSERAGRYVDARGRFVSAATVRADVDRAIRETQARMTALGEQLAGRTLSVKRWEAAMRQEVKTLHAWSAASAKGGWNQMAPSDWGRVGQRVARDYQYLRKFARQLAGGLPRDGRFRRRIALYGESGRKTYEATKREDQAARGYEFEKSIRHALDSCQECIAAEQAGVQPVGRLPLPGDRECGPACKCTLEQVAA